MFYLAFKFETIKNMITQAIKFDKNILEIIDQTCLPAQKKYIPISTLEDSIDAIRKLRIRGAPAIGIFAAYSLYNYSRSLIELDHSAFITKMDYAANILLQTRPTAVNLYWAIGRIKKIYSNNTTTDVKLISGFIGEEAKIIHEEDKKACLQIGYNGLDVLSEPCSVLTHCNTGALATGGWGTALGVIYAAKEQNIDIHVFIDETRPLAQGARLTFWELLENEIPCTLITDSMVGKMMADNKINIVLFGADRIAANGDVANKIGTYGLAVLAKYHNIPCFAVAPSSTFDLTIQSGNEIPIEQRASEEILKLYDYTSPLPNFATVLNPAFDITPSNLLTGIINEVGIIYPPYEKTIYQNINKQINKEIK